MPLLDGKARAAYVAMDSDYASEYDAMKEAILRKYEINRETYRTRFRFDEVQSGETPRELYVRLKGLYEKWMAPTEKSKEEIEDVIVLEQYLQILNAEPKSWIN